jgi:hypothetical protein
MNMNINIILLVLQQQHMCVSKPIVEGLDEL